MNKFINNIGIIAILLLILATGYAIGINIDNIGNAKDVVSKVVTEATDEASK